MTIRRKKSRHVSASLSNDASLNDAQPSQLAGRPPIKKTAQAAAATSTPAPIAMPWRAWARTNSLGVNFVWREIRARRLRVKMAGKRMLVLDTDGRLFLESLPEGPAAMPANLKRPRRAFLEKEL